MRISVPPLVGFVPQQAAQHFAIEVESFRFCSPRATGLCTVGCMLPVWHVPHLALVPVFRQNNANSAKK